MFQSAGKAKYWIFAVIWMVVIFAFSAQANSGAVTEVYLQQGNVPVRKFAHMAEFALLAILLVKAWPVEKGRFVCAFLAALVYALSDEYHQSFVAGRSSSIYDVGVDAIGAVIGLGLFYYFAIGRAGSKQKS